MTCPLGREKCHDIGDLLASILRIDVDAASGLPEWLEAQGLPRMDTVTTMVRNGPLERGPAVGGWALLSQSMG